MVSARKTGDAWLPLAGGDPVEIEGVIYSYETVLVWTNAEREEAGIFEVEEGDASPPGKIVASSTIVDRNGRPMWRNEFVDGPPPPSLDALKADRLGELGAIRYDHEVGGIILPDGSPMKTDRETCALLHAGYTRSKEDPAFAIKNWKVAPGVFVTLDAGEIAALSQVAQAHVQNCFDREAELSGLILAAETPAELAEIDLQEGWVT